MIKDTSEANKAPKREQRFARVIHYNMSYIVQGLEFGTDGAIVLLNDIVSGAFVSADVMRQLASLSRERVAALVLIDSTCYEHSFAENWPLPEMKKRQDYDAPKETKVEDMIRDLGETLPSASVNPQRFRDFMSDYIDQWNSELGKEVLFQQIRLLNPNYTNSVASDLKVLGKPVLITWGEKDQQTPLKL